MRRQQRDALPDPRAVSGPSRSVTGTNLRANRGPERRAGNLPVMGGTSSLRVALPRCRFYAIYMSVMCLMISHVGQRRLTLALALASVFFVVLQHARQLATCGEQQSSIPKRATAAGGTAGREGYSAACICLGRGGRKKGGAGRRKKNYGGARRRTATVFLVAERPGMEGLNNYDLGGPASPTAFALPAAVPGGTRRNRRGDGGKGRHPAWRQRDACRKLVFTRQRRQRGRAPGAGMSPRRDDSPGGHWRSKRRMASGQWVLEKARAIMLCC